MNLTDSQKGLARRMLKRSARVATLASLISRDLRKINPGNLGELQAGCLKLFDVTTALYAAVNSLLEAKNETDGGDNPDPVRDLCSGDGLLSKRNL